MQFRYRRRRCRCWQRVASLQDQAEAGDDKQTRWPNGKQTELIEAAAAAGRHLPHPVAVVVATVSAVVRRPRPYRLPQ